MLPSRYRGRYSLIILLSLLLHFTAVVVLFWVADEKQEEKEEKTVIVTLKKKEEPKKEEPKKEEPKKEEPKKEEPKKEEPKKEEPKKEEPKKEEPKKEEPKKEEPKKEEPKKEEPKKEEPKKEEPKKVEPKKVEPKKVEPKKVEPKKVEPKKVEPKKEEPKKVEPKKAEPKKINQKNEVPRPIIQDSLSNYQDKEDSESEEYATETQLGLIRFNSMQELQEQEMAKLIVSNESLDKTFMKRNREGEIKKEEFSNFEVIAFNNAMNDYFSIIEKNIKPIKWDGGNYYGEINFYISKAGYIEKIVIKKPSGNDALDQIIIDALLKTKKLPISPNPKIHEVMYLTKKLIFYSDKDMIR